MPSPYEIHGGLIYGENVVRDGRAFAKSETMSNGVGCELRRGYMALIEQGGAYN